MNSVSSVMNSVSGQQQGDTLGTLLFCIGLQPVLRDSPREEITAAKPKSLIPGEGGGEMCVSN